MSFSGTGVNGREMRSLLDEVDFLYRDQRGIHRVDVDKLDLRGTELEGIDSSKYDFKELRFDGIVKDEKFIPPCDVDCFVLVDGVPKVEDKRCEKLKKVLAAKISTFGTKVDVDDIYIPMDDTPDGPMGSGVAMVRFPTPESAFGSVVVGDGQRLDSKTTLRFFNFSLVKNILEMPEECAPPQEMKETCCGHLKSWLLDKEVRPHFVTVRGGTVSICRLDKTKGPEVTFARENWTGYYVSWSPNGSYLTTFHDLGIAIWGGESWEQLCKLGHERVRLADYSPNERYVVTWSQYPVSRVMNESHNLAIWEISSSTMLKSFKIHLPQSNNNNVQGALKIRVDWPVLKWSYDEKYFARIYKDSLYIYEVPSMKCIAGKNLKISNVMEYSWSPCDNLIAYWIPEADNVPAKVNIMSIPSMEIIRSKNLFGVNNCQIYWQSKGDYLLLHVERIKSKKQDLTGLELFRIREKNVPVDNITVGVNVVVPKVYWEPAGTRFAILVSDADSTVCHIYDVAPANLTQKNQKKNVIAATPQEAPSDIKLLKVIPAKDMNCVVWAPRRGRLVIAGIRDSRSGEIQFWDMNEMLLLGTGSHMSCTALEWDPSGRYLASFISQWHANYKTGYNLWSFTGKQIFSEYINGFEQLLWRPRPAFLFPKEIEDKINRKLKEYSREFGREDALVEKQMQDRIRSKNRKAMAEWMSYVSKIDEIYNETREERKSLWGFDIDSYTDEKTEVITEVVEEVVEESYQ